MTIRPQKNSYFYLKMRLLLITLCFHCQQTVEKFLKAFLIFHNIEFEKVHTLEYLKYLIMLCMNVDTEFEKLYEITKDSTEYAIEISG